MLTKQEKVIQVKNASTLIKESKNLVFADFTGVGIEAIRRLKKELKKTEAQFRVFKKRLLRIAFKETGIEWDPLSVKSQVGVIFLPQELSSAASAIHAFAKSLVKENIAFKILGGYNAHLKKGFTADEFTVIAKLPSREALLGMLVGVLAGPIRSLLYVLQEQGKKMVETKQ